MPSRARTQRFERLEAQPRHGVRRHGHLAVLCIDVVIGSWRSPLPDALAIRPGDQGVEQFAGRGQGHTAPCGSTPGLIGAAPALERLPVLSRFSNRAGPDPAGARRLRPVLGPMAIHARCRVQIGASRHVR